MSSYVSRTSIHVEVDILISQNNKINKWMNIENVQRSVAQVDYIQVKRMK